MWLPRNASFIFLTSAARPLESGQRVRLPPSTPSHVPLFHVRLLLYVSGKHLHGNGIIWLSIRAAHGHQTHCFSSNLVPHNTVRPSKSPFSHKFRDFFSHDSKNTIKRTVKYNLKPKRGHLVLKDCHIKNKLNKPSHRHGITFSEWPCCHVQTEAPLLTQSGALSVNGIPVVETLHAVPAKCSIFVTRGNSYIFHMQNLARCISSVPRGWDRTTRDCPSWGVIRRTGSYKSKR